MTLTAEQGQEFLLHDGMKIATVHELLAALQQMPLSEFQTFVDEKKNDFSNWLQYALHEDVLAERLRSTANKDITILKIAERLEERKAEQNLFTLAQTGTLREQEKPKAAAQMAPMQQQRASVSIPLIKITLLWKELIIGALFGIFLGIFLGRIIAAWMG